MMIRSLMLTCSLWVGLVTMAGGCTHDLSQSCGGSYVPELRDVSVTTVQGLVTAVAVGNSYSAPSTPVIWRSSNGGKTWSDMGGTFPSYGKALGAVQLLPSGEILAAGASGMFYHSKDLGKTWTSKTVATQYLSEIACEAPGRILLAGLGHREVVLSRDGGASFAMIKDPVINTYNTWIISLAASGTGRAYLGQTTTGAVLYSTW